MSNPPDTRHDDPPLFIDDAQDAASPTFRFVLDPASSDSNIPDHTTEIIDVWSRTSPKYRVRAVVMLLTLLLLFGGLCCFTFWLRTGVFWPFESENYTALMQRSFRPTGAGQITLSDFLLSPISVKDVPVHGVIMGLLFASLCSIPILVAILYRFPFSVLFAAMVCFLAVMPWLAVTTVVGCVLASWPRFRFRFRYASALLGLTPIALYFIMASWEPAGGRVKSIENVALLYAPWVLALLSSCVICAVVLAIARLINYRPGGIAPVLAILFLTPVVIFHSKVGRDELAYRLLEREVGPGSQSMFAPLDVAAAADREATRRWSRRRESSYDEVFRQVLEEELQLVLEGLENDRLRAGALCDAFIDHFPRSPYIPHVLFLKGQALDQRINRNKLFFQHRAEFRNDLPSHRSWRTWQSLVEQFPGHELAAMGLLKLAILEAREGRLAGARAMLDQKLETENKRQAGMTRGGSEVSGTSDGGMTGQQTVPTMKQTVTELSMFRKSSRSKMLGVQLQGLLRDAARLREQIADCESDAARPVSELWRNEGTYLVHPLGVLLSLDETDPYYASNLQGIVDHFRGSRSAEYAELSLISLEPAVSRRIVRYRTATQAFAGRAVAAKAMFFLAEVLQEDSLLDESRTLLGELIKLYSESCWAQEARDRLASLALVDHSGQVASN